MSIRTDVYRAWPQGLKAFSAFSEAISSALPVNVVNLVNVRVSQMNGCAVCLDMHTREAIEAGEDERRLHTVAAWRDTDSYSREERAALALAEAVPRLDTPPDVDLVDEAVAVFGEDGFTRLLWAIVAINGWNRVNVTARLRPPATADACIVTEMDAPTAETVIDEMKRLGG